MAEQGHPAVRVGRLSVRLPGESAEAGRRMAGGIGERMARKVPSGVRRDLGALRVRVQVSPGSTEAETSDAITDAVAKALRKPDAALNASDRKTRR